MKKFNVHFLIFFIIIFSVSISDIFIYFLKSSFILTNIIILLINLGCLIYLKKKNKIEIKSDFSKFDFIFIFGLIAYMIFSIVFPDLSWDTRSYHIYLQENTFVNKINFDFFAGRNLNSFLFALGDRFYYLFRYVLGYRLGTLMSYYVILVLFYQIKNIMKKLTKSCNECFISLISIIPCVMSIIFAFAGTYYIDNLGLVCLVEIFSIILFDDNHFKEKIKLYILAIIVGIAISIKVTNIIFVLPIGLYFIIKNIKNFKVLKIYDYFIIIALVILPFGTYALDSFIQTGNPVFPYYNNIFKSDYFMMSEWKDTNFGPTNIIEFLIWPIYIVFNPNRAFDTRFVDLLWGIGFVFEIGYIVFCLIKRKIKNNPKFVLTLTVLLATYLWEKLIIGYVRYATVILVLSIIVLLSCAYTQYASKKWITIITLLIIMISTIPSCGYDLLVKVKDYNNIGEYLKEYKNNAKLILNDRCFNKTDVDGILGAIGDDSLIPTLIRKNQEIYNLEEWVTATSDRTKKMYNDKILNQEIYIFCDEDTIERKKMYLENNDFVIIDELECNENYDFLSPNDMMYILKVIKKQ